MSSAEVQARASPGDVTTHRDANLLAALHDNEVRGVERALHGDWRYGRQQWHHRR
jgi:hypothetical protein